MGGTISLLKYSFARNGFIQLNLVALMSLKRSCNKCDRFFVALVILQSIPKCFFVTACLLQHRHVKM